MHTGFKAKLWLSPIVVMMLVAIVSWWVHQPPERFASGRTVLLDTAHFTLDAGHAYWAPLEEGFQDLASDKDGVSQVLLFEDGVQLTGHALHADIRSHGGGLYSHWGQAILLSTRDGTDPRTHGRRYELRLPPTLPIWHRAAQVGLLILALVFMLRWFHGKVGGSWLKAWAWTLGGAAALATLVLVAGFLASPARELREFREAMDRDVTSGSDSLTTPRSRTRHLLRSADAAMFNAVASPEVKRPSRTIRLRPTQEARVDRGYVELVGESELRSVTLLNVSASDLDSIVLELEVARGNSLILGLSGCGDSADAEPAITLSFSISPSPGLQTFRFLRPALGAMECLRGVAIRAHPGAGASPKVRVESMRYSLRLDAFAEKPSGFVPVELQGSLRPALWQSVPGHFAIPVREGDGRWLKLAVGALAEPPATPIDFVVSAMDRRGRRSVIHRDSVRPGDGWRQLAWSLSEDVQEVRLEAERLSPRSALLWSGARLIDRDQPPRRIVMILADTLRADALGCYGHEGNPTPALDALARQGVRFARAFSQSYWTRPSMASIMTGHYAAATGVQMADKKLPDAYETLAESFAEGGFTTVGIVTNSNAGPHAGLDQGFDWLRLKLSLTFQQQRQTDRLIEEIVLPTLDGLDDDDLFLYLHLMETHGPYGPPEPPGADFELPTTGPPLAFDSRFDRPWNPRPTAAQRIALYDYDVRSMDRALGEFFAHLDRRWLGSGREPPVLAFVSDHGELLGERDQWGHGWADLYPENVQVPMIIRAPGRIAPQTDFLHPVEIRHLAGTLLDLAGIARRPDSSGSVAVWRSLLPQLGIMAEPAASSFAVSAAEQGESAIFSLFGRRQSYVTRIVKGTPNIAIFGDDGFERGLTGPWPRPILEHELLRGHGSYLESQGEIREQYWTVSGDAVHTIDSQALESLKALGYIQD